ncbi:COG2963 Transposase and inactivated derivatives [Methylophilaceae bacterium]|jgi:transposase
MSSKRFTEEFKLEAIKLITERQYSISEVSSRLGVTTNSLYAWLKKYNQPEPVKMAAANQHATIKRLQSELKRVTEERDILKKAAAYFAKESL